MTKILQNSPEWLEAKQSKIGASEVFTLVAHYCKPELKALGFDLSKEKPFRTIQELFLKVKFGAKLSEIDPVFAEFGLGMEEYTNQRLEHEKPQLLIERSKEFFINEALHPLAACSPDGFIKTLDLTILHDFDHQKEINTLWGDGVLELKTTNYFANFGSEEGAKTQYLFQLQFQQMVLGLKWGIIAVLMPKEKAFDDPFFKGRILEKAESGKFDEINQYFDLVHYVHPALPAFQAMIMKALNAFQADLDAYDTNPSVFPRNSEDLAGLQREKQLWGQLWPEKFGTKQLEESEEFNRLLNERYQAQVESLFAEANLLKVTNEIIAKTKAEGLDKYCEIVGTENRITWIKNGQTRFYKIGK